MRAILVDALPFHLGEDNFFAIDRALRDDLPAGRANETLAPKFNAIPSRWRFMTHAIHHRNIAAVGYGMSALHRLPSGKLRRAVFLFLARMPANGRGVKQNLSVAQSRQSRSLRIALVPAKADADVSALRSPILESQISGGEIKLLIEPGIIRDVHLAIFAE